MEPTAIVFGVGATEEASSAGAFVRYQFNVPPPEGVAVNGVATLFWHKYIGELTVGGAVARIMFSELLTQVLAKTDAFDKAAIKNRQTNNLVIFFIFLGFRLLKIWGI